MVLHIKHFIEAFHVRIWRITLIFPCNGHSKWPKLQYLFANAQAISMILLTVTFLLKVLEIGTENINDTTYAMLYCVMFTLITLKYVLFRMRRKRLHRLLAIVFQLEKTTSQSDQVEQSLITNCTKLMKWMAAICLISFVIAFCGLCFANFIQKERTLLFPSKLPATIDWQHNDLVFGLCCICQNFSTLFVLAVVSTVELFGPNLLMILNVYITILERRIGHIGWDWNESNTILHAAFRTEIINCIKFHRLCIR